MNLTVCTMDQAFVVVCDDAIITVTHTTANEAAGRMLGGAVGSGIMHKLEQKEAAPPVSTSDWRTSTELIRCRASDVPQELARDPSWPRVEPSRTVSIYPRLALSAVKVSWLRGLLLTLKKMPVPITAVGIAPWHIGKVKRHLTRAKYPLT